jgi:hypothetical protein
MCVTVGFYTGSQSVKRTPEFLCQTLAPPEDMAYQNKSVKIRLSESQEIMPYDEYMILKVLFRSSGSSGRSIIRDVWLAANMGSSFTNS